MATIPTKLQQVRHRVENACVAAQRPVHSVTLLAVSKTFSAACVREAFGAGQRCFGENYVQEAVEKMGQVADLPGLEWHFIGPLQGNKARLVAEHFSWVHSVDRLDIAKRLSRARPEHLPPLQVCLQVNVSGEASKSGVQPHELEALARGVAPLPRLELRGLMAIPAPSHDADEAARRAPFAHLRHLLESLQLLELEAPRLDTLSMGMSDDLEPAIAEGATLVRVGSAIFGARA